VIFRKLCYRLFYIVLLVFGITPGLQAAEPEKPVTSVIESVIDPEPQEITEEAIERELTAGEDPLVPKISELQGKPAYQYKDHTSIKLYGSARLRYAKTDHQGDWDDGGSRVGLNGELQFRPQFWLLGRAEVGFNIFDAVDNVLGASDRLRDDGAASARLLYGGVQTPSTTLTLGKNWSSYYQVSGITDRFEVFGSDASGTFNALTDGGASGTGRADNVLQGRFSIDSLPEKWQLKPFKLNVQLQHGESIPQINGAEYSHSLGISALLESNSEKVIGIAYNQAFIDNEDLPALKAQGINGDARALVIGTRQFSDKYYVGTTLSRLENHETTDDESYFDGWGWEVFGSYNFANRWWMIGGWNLLEPDQNEALAGDYRLRYGVLGVRFTFDEFRQMIFSEIRLDDSRNADGTRPGNVYTIGVRWDLP
jgi:predicted porin